MKRMTGVALSCLLWVGVGCAQAAPAAAKATLVNAENRTVGTAVLAEAPGGVRIQLDLAGLPPGLHAVHIHEAGRCDPPDFKSAGGHFNPHAKHHGMKNPEGPHAGDLPNVAVGPDGTAHLDLLAVGVTLGEGETSLFHPGGTALVIHAGPDDDRTDPAGNSGARIACGVIER